ncbi:SspB-related isopeptide-forming adhesin, partial [Streptococcus sp. zg-JUN1979]|uniref:SspB-related isopeptide-forming adhesin n=1 Tax=Streptococcus sp. zg-JUN1979 TaxID=3391450 RepID=UPI0039AF0750
STVAGSTSFGDQWKSLVDSGDAYGSVPIAVGERIEVIYSGLTNTEVNGQKADKVVIGYRLKSYTPSPDRASDASTDVYLLLLNDPTNGVRTTQAGGSVEYELDISYLDSNGSFINFKGADVVISANSLNHTDTGLWNQLYRSTEYVDVSDTGASLVEINGSSIGAFGTVGKAKWNNDYKGTAGVNEDGQTDYPVWDSEDNPNFWYGSIAVKYQNVQGTLLKINFGANMREEYWFTFNTNTPYPVSLKPDPVTPRMFEATPEKELPATPTKQTFTPETPTVKPHVKVPEKETFSVAVHPVLVSQKPINDKEVVNTDNVSIDGKLVAKGSTVVWELNNENLKAGRETVTAYVMEDPAPTGFLVDLDGTKEKNAGAYLVTVSEDGVVRFEATDLTLGVLNANRSQDVKVPVAYLVGSPQNDGATYENVFTTTITTPKGEFKTVSDKPVVYTPGVDPENPRTTPDGNNPTPNDNLIQPKKDVVDEAGNSINGQSVLPNTKINYILTQNFDQYKGMLASKDSIAKGFLYAEDYLDEALDGKSMVVNSITALNGDDVSQLLDMYHVLSQDALDEKLQAIIKNSGISPVGEFYLWVAKDPQAFYEAYVQKGLDITYNVSFKIKDTFTEGDITNGTYQIDFANGYYSNIVVNNL